MKNFLRKLGSIKTWIALWSMAIITWIVIKNEDAFNNVAMLLIGPITAYLGVNVWQDKLYLDTGKKELGK